LLDYTVHNYMEDIIKNLVKEMLRERPDVCDCDTCYWDICALVLNRIKPQYLEIETNIQKLSPFMLNRLRNLVLDAMVLVANNARPYHGKDQTVTIQLQNLSEPLVRRILTEMSETNEFLRENKESLPVIAAMILNQLEPRYAVTDRGGAYLRARELELQFLPSIMSKVYNVVKQFQG